MTDAQQRSAAAYRLGLSLSKVFGCHETAWLERDEECSDGVLEQLEELKEAAGELSFDGDIEGLCERADYLWRHQTNGRSHVVCSAVYRAVAKWAELSSPGEGGEGRMITRWLADLIEDVLAATLPDREATQEKIQRQVDSRLREELEGGGPVSWEDMNGVIVGAGVSSLPDGVEETTKEMVSGRLREVCRKIPCRTGMNLDPVTDTKQTLAQDYWAPEDGLRGQEVRHRLARVRGELLKSSPLFYEKPPPPDHRPFGEPEIVPLGVLEDLSHEVVKAVHNLENPHDRCFLIGFQLGLIRCELPLIPTTLLWHNSWLLTDSPDPRHSSYGEKPDWVFQEWLSPNWLEYIQGNLISNLDELGGLNTEQGTEVPIEEWAGELERHLHREIVVAAAYEESEQEGRILTVTAHSECLVLKFQTPDGDTWKLELKGQRGGWSKAYPHLRYLLQQLQKDLKARKPDREVG